MSCSPFDAASDRTDGLAVYDAYGGLTEVTGLLASAYKNADRVKTPPFEVHTFALDGLWVPEDQA